jgi:pyrroloquinoline quinone biosynthesis protein B
MMKRRLMFCCALLATACAAPPAPPPARQATAAPTATIETRDHAPKPDRDVGQPYVVVLGTAQDAGLPQVGCDRAICRRAHREPSFRRLVTSLLLCDPRSGNRWLFDATPDIHEQVRRAAHYPRSRQRQGARPPLFEGIFLTHAHIGHYTGLMFLGRESYGAKDLPVYGSERMRAFLRDNGPWSQLVSLGNITLHPIAPDQPVPVATDISVRALRVVHRDELSDTLAFVLQGPSRKLLYLPDIDKWQRWDQRIESLLAGVDVALIDGTFFAEGEIPGRSMSEIPHPFITESIERFGALPASERAKVIFTHLNHTNPASDPASDASEQIRAAGMAVATEMQIIPL